MPFSDYMMGLLAEWYRGVANFPAAPTAIYVDLFVGDPTPAGTGGTNVTAQIRSNGSVPVTLGSEVNGVISNSAIVDFGNSANEILNVSHFALFDAQSGTRNQLYQAAFSNSKNIVIGQSVAFDIGDILITAAVGLSEYLRGKIFDWLKNVAPFPTAPTNVYDALFNGDPTPAGTGGTEVTTSLDSSNGRLPITFGALSNGAITNSIIVDHGTADNAATADFVAIYDAQTGGNQLCQTANAGITDYLVGEAVNIQSGQLQINFN